MEEKQDFPFADLSYKVIGCLYKVFNDLGFGYPEKIYQKAISNELKAGGLEFTKENISKIRYKDRVIGYYFHDFLINNRLILEVKVGNGFYHNQMRQVLSYLRDAKLRLGIVSIFSPNGVIIKRIVNPDLRSKSA
ncbi:MAG: GxxExxY protein [Patescibacteria group bacterium]|nr:GxxExxY protein [Patescibacteria group bacterium]